MTIKDICDLCINLDSVNRRLDAEQKFKQNIKGHWKDDCSGMKMIDSEILRLEKERDIIHTQMRPYIRVDEID